MKNHLEHFRKRKGYTQMSLSDVSGVSVATICHIENRGIIPTGAVMIALSNALQVPAVAIFPALGAVNYTRGSENDEKVTGDERGA